MKWSIAVVGSLLLMLTPKCTNASITSALPAFTEECSRGPCVELDVLFRKIRLAPMFGVLAVVHAVQSSLAIDTDVSRLEVIIKFLNMT